MNRAYVKTDDSILDVPRCNDPFGKHMNRDLEKQGPHFQVSPLDLS